LFELVEQDGQAGKVRRSGQSIAASSRLLPRETFGTQSRECRRLLPETCGHRLDSRESFIFIVCEESHLQEDPSSGAMRTVYFTGCGL